MNRRTSLLLAGALVVFAVVAVFFAAHHTPSTIGASSVDGDGATAPALHAKGWIGTEPLTPAKLRGKVVLYDFWTYSCVNCVRTIPYLRAWHDRYAKDGLVVIGVHSPEFDFEKDHANVRRAVKELGVDYPVALDDDMDIWNAFANQYWPADYLYGRNGKQASVHFGEGGYTDTEDEIRTLLGVGASVPRADPKGQMGGAQTSDDLTGETYNGSERGQEGFASPQPLVEGVADYTTPDQLDLGAHGLRGTWHVTSQYVEAARPGAAVVLRYRAAQVNLVMATKGPPVDAVVRVDGGAPKEVHVADADLYRLVTDPKVGEHTVTVTASASGLRAFAFTFGG